MDKNHSSSYPRKDFKREGYSSKPHSRKKPYHNISFAKPIVSKPSLQYLNKFITIGQIFIDGHKYNICKEKKNLEKN